MMDQRLLRERAFELAAEARRRKDRAVEAAADARMEAFAAASRTRDAAWDGLRRRLSELRNTQPRTSEINKQIEATQYEMIAWRQSPPQIDGGPAQAAYEAACAEADAVLAAELDAIRAGLRAGQLPDAA